MSGRLFIDELIANTGTIKLTQNNQTLLLQPSIVGELKIMRVRQTPSPAFPYWNLSEADQLLQSSIYPDYVNYLRNIRVETNSFTTLNGTGSASANTLTLSQAQSLSAGQIIYFHLAGQFRTITSNNGSALSHSMNEPFSGSSQQISVINFSSYISSFTGSWTSATQFTLTNTSGSNLLLLAALLEDNAYGANYGANNSYTNWMTLRSNQIESNIVGITNNVITISGATYTTGVSTIEIYPHRVPSISTQARHKQVDDSTVVNGGMQVVNGLRVRDRQQSHIHTDSGHNHTLKYWVAANGASASWGLSYINNVYSQEQNQWAYNDASNANIGPQVANNSENMRTGQFNRPRALGVYLYEYMGQVNS